MKTLHAIRAVVAALALWPAVGAAQSATSASELPETVPSDDLDFAFAASTGLLYSSGDYGTGFDTNIAVIPFGLRARLGAFRLSATLPYLRLDSPGVVVVGGDGSPIIIDPNRPIAQTRREGFGDLTLRAAYGFSATWLGGVDLDISGRVKFPTSAESKFLGTGETDFALAGEASFPVGSWSPFVNVGYRFFGDPPGLDLRNGFATSIGTTKQFGRMVAVFSYDYSRAVTSATDDAHELFAALSGPLFRQLNYAAYGIVGLSDGSPDYGLGLLLTVSLF